MPSAPPRGLQLFGIISLDVSGTTSPVRGVSVVAFRDVGALVRRWRDGILGSADNALSSDSPLQQNLGSTLAELQRMARSLRALTDYLGVHPEALIRGRPDDPSSASRERTNPPARQGSKP